MRAPDAGTPQPEPQPTTIGEMRGDSPNNMDLPASWRRPHARDRRANRVPDTSARPSIASIRRQGGIDVKGRVEMWRGFFRSIISVSAPFVWRCLSGSTVAPFPHPAHRTGHADF